MRLPQIAFPEPLVQMAISPVNRADEEKLQSGLHRLHDEDPSFESHWSAETHETLVSGLGERHLEVALAKLKRKFGVVAELRRPRIAYRETIRARAEGQGRHKKQSGGRGQFGDCWVRIAPVPRGDGIQFEDQIVGGSIPSKFIPAVEKGIHEAAERGVLAGISARRLQGRAVRRLVSHRGLERDVVQDGGDPRLQDGGAEVQAGAARAARRGGRSSSPTTVSATCSAISRRAARRSSAPSPRRRTCSGTRVRAIVPQSELHLYASALQSMTHGRARLRREFRGYEEMPGEAAQRVIQETRRSRRGGGRALNCTAVPGAEMTIAGSERSTGPDTARGAQDQPQGADPLHRRV